MQNAPGLDRVMCQRLGGRFRCRVGQTPACSCVCGCGSKSDVVIVLSPEASAAHPQLMNGGEFRTAKVTTGSLGHWHVQCAAFYRRSPAAIMMLSCRWAVLCSAVLSRASLDCSRAAVPGRAVLLFCCAVLSCAVRLS